MTELLIFFLALSLIFYVLFGGADFGAGIVEMLSPQKGWETPGRAIGPVWEANHVWLILIVVILFMGFPRLYSTMSLYLHIPLTMMLIGIIFRGTAFAYLHYDAVHDRTNRWYRTAFHLSSLLTPLFLGIVVGAMILGQMTGGAETFREAFIDPWFNLFCFSVGFFCIALFTWLAAVYLTGETGEGEERSFYIRCARRFSLISAGGGLLVFATAEWSRLPLAGRFIREPFAAAAVILAILALGTLWYLLGRRQAIIPRLLAGFQVLCILSAWFVVQHPVVIRLREGVLTFHGTAAPEATQLQLLIALAAGSVIILPALFYLLRTFKGEQFHRS